MPRQQGILRLTHLQCSQFAWSRNQGRVTSSHAADSVTFAERVQEIPSPDHRKKYTGVVNTVLRYSNELQLHQHVCHEIGDTMVRTSRFTVILDFAICHSRSLHKLNLEMKTPIADSAVFECSLLRSSSAASWM